MNIRDAKKKPYYLITSISALLALLSCFALPFASVTNQTPPLTLSFTGMEMVGTNWLNLILALAMIIVAAKCALSHNPFEIEAIPPATQEYWIKNGLIIAALLGMLINIWALFNMKQFFSTYSLVSNHYSVKLMVGGWLLLICMLSIVISNLLHRVPAPPRRAAEVPHLPQQSAAMPPAGNAFTPQQGSARAPMPPQAPPMQAPGQKIAPAPAASSFPAQQAAPPSRTFNAPVVPQQAKQQPAQQKPFSLPALPQTPPVQPALQYKPVAAQKGGQSIVQQKPFSLPALPQTPPVQPALQQRGVLFPASANHQQSQQQAAGQQQAVPPQASPQQRPFSLPALPPDQSKDQQKPAAPAAQAVQQKLLSLPGLPQDAKNRATGQKDADARPAQPNAAAIQNSAAQIAESARQEETKGTRSQFMKPPSQAGT